MVGPKAAGPLREQNKHGLVEGASGLLQDAVGSALAYVEKVPVKFGEIGRLSGLYFGCTGCARGTLFIAIELVRLFGTEGRVSDLAKRLACEFCKPHRRRASRVFVEPSRPLYSKVELARLTATEVDALVYRLEKLKPRKTIS